MSGDGKVVAFSIGESPCPSSEGGVQPEDARLDRLFEDLYEYTARYVGWSDEFRAGAVAWCMASWIYRRFDSFPYLQFIGPPAKGKSRSTKVIAALAYEPFECSCATAAVIYRKANQGVTLIMDEVDETLSRETRNILRYGFSKGGRVMRCRTVTRHQEKTDITDYDVAGFDPYCPKVLSGQTPLGDPALQTRILTMNMAKAPARDEPWPPYLPESFEKDKKGLRSRLGTWAKDNAAIDYAKVEFPDAMDSRQRQVFLPLYCVSSAKWRESLDKLARTHADFVARYTSGSVDVEVVQVLVDMGYPSEFYPGRLADRINETRHDDDKVSSKYIGTILEKLGYERKRRTADGIPFGADDGQTEELALSMGIQTPAKATP